MSVESFDRAFRRRMMIAIAISVVVNAVVFGAAGIVGHRFLQSLQIMREKQPPQDVTIRRIYIRDLPGGGIKIETQDPNQSTPSNQPAAGPKSH
jgi:hypothetical protein